MVRVRWIRLWALSTLVLVVVLACDRAPPNEAQLDDVAVNNATPRRAELIRWAMHAYQSAGLGWPPVVEISFPPTPSCRGGKMGTFARTDEGCMIAICTPDRRSGQNDAFPLTVRRTMLHELGHCWADTFVNGETKVHFLESRSLECWECHTDWQHKGCEHAAEVIEWGTIDTVGLCRVPPCDCASMTSAFEILTGKPPILRLLDCTDEPIDYFTAP